MAEYMIVRTRKFRKGVTSKQLANTPNSSLSGQKNLFSPIPSHAKASDSEWFLGLLRDLGDIVVQVMSGPSLEKVKNKSDFSIVSDADSDLLHKMHFLICQWLLLSRCVYDD